MKYDNQLRYAVNIIKQYDGRFPLSIWLKDFFRENKQMGSRDRKTVSQLVYSYFRLGHSSFGTVEERMLAGITLCDPGSELQHYFKPALPAITPSAIFPWPGLLSKEVDAQEFSLSFLEQPRLFLRIRPGKQKLVLQKLKAAGTEFVLIDESCISLPNNTKADTLLEINKEVIIQDLSSQRVGEFMKNLSSVSVWDCCAASGGKSIMASDFIKNIRLTVSDIRPSIISNLHERFKQAGINEYNVFTGDLSDPDYTLPDYKYDLIIADVPCSGSGTWARTPEQLYYFDPARIRYYADLQKKIISKVIPALKPGGTLLYITCSVFKSENEEAVEFIKNNYRLSLNKMELIKGYDKKADTMFAASFTS